METSNPASPPRRWPGRLLIILFVVLLMLPLLDMAFHFDTTAIQSENRLPAPLPSLPNRIGGLGKFLSDLEAYFNDHFGCRRLLIMWHNKFCRWLFKDNSKPRDVLVGTDGWLFYTGSQMIDRYRGELQFTETELHGWQNLLERRRDWLARRGIKYIFVLAPDKQSVYPEYLPAWLRNIGRQTKTDQFFSYMKAHSTVQLLDLRTTLLAAKKSAPVYKKTDMHWNQFGAFMACEDLIRVLAEQELPRLTPLAPDTFDHTNRLVEGGDLARMLGSSLIESNAIILTPKPELPALEIFDPTVNPSQVMAFSKQPGGHGLAIVYQDSFGRYWVPFLGYQFGEVDYFWQPAFDPKTIEQKKPVVVVNEMVEYLLNTSDPGKLSAKDALP
jgi:hypothetical protein